MKYKRISEGSRYYVNLEEVRWAVGYKENPLVEVIPAGTPFDVSVPWFLGWLFDRHNEKYFLASLLHDEFLRRGYDRVTAAGAFNHGLKKSGVPYATRFFMTLGVAIFKFK